MTGARSGIGTAALRAGDRVVATGRGLDRLRAAFPGNAGEAMALVELDVTDEAQAAAAIEDDAKQGPARNA